MNCPVCNCVELKTVERRGVGVDCCPNCRGVWLKQEELDAIMEHDANPTNAAYPSGGDHGRHYLENTQRKRYFVNEWSA